jgi:hypothetical protein
MTVEQQAMIALFQRHVEAELAGDLDGTMATMTDDPHLKWCLEDISGRAMSFLPTAWPSAVLLALSSVDVIERSVGGSPAGSSRSGAYRRSKTH